MEIPVGMKALEICQGNPWWKKLVGWPAKTVALRCRRGVASLQCDPVRSPRTFENVPSPHRAVVKKKGETWQDQDDATSQCPKIQKRFCSKDQRKPVPRRALQFNRANENGN